MKLKPQLTIADYFSDLNDKRVERTKRHQLINTALSDAMMYSSSNE